MPTTNVYIPPKVREKLDFLLESQYWSIDRLKEFQSKKLSLLLEHAYSKVPYYKNLFKTKGIDVKKVMVPDDLSGFPILTKTKIRNCFEQLISTDVDISLLKLNSTGGSTGVPLKIYQDSNYSEWQAAAITRNWKYFPGFDENEIEALLWGAVQDIGKGITLKDIIRFIRTPKIKINTFELNKMKLWTFVILFNIVKPKILRGYASSLFFVAEWLERKNIRIHSPKSVVSSSETLSPKMRSKISKIFNSDILDSYGCREVSQIAMECEYHCGLHVAMENQIVELVDNGEGMKKVLITNLNNFCMPLIRYEVGDLADKIIEDKCECGRTLLRINKIHGRVNENIILENGTIINGEYFEFLFYEIDSIERYQVQYSSSSKEMTIKLKGFTRDDRVIKFLKDQIFKHFQFTNLNILYTDKFDKTPSGKFKFVWVTE